MIGDVIDEVVHSQLLNMGSAQTDGMNGSTLKDEEKPKKKSKKSPEGSKVLVRQKTTLKRIDSFEL